MPGTAVSNFSYNGKPISARIIDGDVWFVGAEVCAALDIRNHRSALARLDDDEKGVGSTDTLGGKQDAIIISLPGAYRLVFSSRKPSAEAFKRWLAHDVIPAIRKTGRYEAAPAPAIPTLATSKGDKALARYARRVRHAKFALVESVMRLEALGVDTASIDMGVVRDFGRKLLSPSLVRAA